MPPARSANAAPRRHSRQTRQPASRPPRVLRQGPKLRVRWERLGRFGLLFVLAVVIGLYAEHTLSYLSARAQAGRQSAIVGQLARQNAALRREAQSLQNPAAIVRDARALGMVRPGEQSYVISAPSTR